MFDPVDMSVLPESETEFQSQAVEVTSKRSKSLFIWLYASLAGSLLLRWSVLDFESRDYRLYLAAR